MLRATALLPHTRYSESEWRSFAQLSAHQETSSAFAVTGGTTLELTLAQYWSRQAFMAPSGFAFQSRTRLLNVGFD